MKIVRADLQSTKVATRRVHRMAIGTTTHQENVVVRLYTDDGQVGEGEAPHMVGHSQLGETPDTVRVVLARRLLPAIGGLDPLGLDTVSAVLDRAVPGNGRAKGAVMMAVYDLAGRILGVPVSVLLGGRYRERIPLSWSLPIVDDDVALAEAHEMVGRGWRILKVKAGRRRPREDVRLVDRLRQEFGDTVAIRADANQAYDVKTALRVLRALEPYEIDFFEQPVHRDNLDGMRYLTRDAGVAIPVMADESAKSPTDLMAIGRLGAADAVSIYIVGPGGPGRSRQMAVLAEGFGMRGYVGGALESGLGTAAGLHLAAACPAIDLGCEMVGPYLLETDLAEEPPVMVDGALLVPSGPGLGVRLDDGKLAKARIGDVQTFSFDTA